MAGVTTNIKAGEHSNGKMEPAMLEISSMGRGMEKERTST